VATAVVRNMAKTTVAWPAGTFLGKFCSSEPQELTHVLLIASVCYVVKYYSLIKLFQNFLNKFSNKC